MPGLPVEFHPEAVAEASAAFAWYYERSEIAAATFLKELDDAVSRISEAPTRGPGYHEDTRRFLLRRFPFFIVYRVTGGTVEVVAVAHGRRRPGYGRGR